jgi:hypothetical protein
MTFPRDTWALLAICFIPLSCLALKMEATCSPKMVADFELTTWRYIPRNRNRYNTSVNNDHRNSVFFDLYVNSWDITLPQGMPIPLSIQYSKALLIQLHFNQMSDNLHQNTKNKKCCSQLSTNFKRHAVFRKADESLVCSYKTRQFLQIYISKNNYHFWVIYRKINVLSFYSSYKRALQQ